MAMSLFCQSCSISRLILFDCDVILLQNSPFIRKKVNSTELLQTKSILNVSKIVTVIENILQIDFFKAEKELMNRNETKSSGNFRGKIQIFEALQYKIL